MNNIIEAKSLSYTYLTHNKLADEESVALDGIDLAIKAGSFVAVLGHNGSGKSTLAKHFNAILLPSGGKVYIDGLDTADDAVTIEIRSRVGMVF
jgi:energy-coupling factor transport system ATP-binding protein